MIVFRTVAGDTLNPVKPLTMNPRSSHPANSSRICRLQGAVARLSRCWIDRTGLWIRRERGTSAAHLIYPGPSGKLGAKLSLFVVGSRGRVGNRPVRCGRSRRILMDSSPHAVSKIAIVTGAGSGIGKAVAIAFAPEGYSVGLAGRRKQLLEATALEARQANSRTLALPADVSDPASVRELFAKTKEAFGRLDLLFNNAGTSGRATALEDLTLEQWRSIVDTNLSGTC